MWRVSCHLAAPTRRSPGKRLDPDSSRSPWLPVGLRRERVAQSQGVSESLHQSVGWRIVLVDRKRALGFSTSSRPCVSGIW
jgi:hypothetical protein